MRNKYREVGAFSILLSTVLLIIALRSTEREDRIATVECDARHGGGLSVDTGWLETRKSPGIGFLMPRPLPSGSILQLRSNTNRDALGIADVVYSLPITDSDFSPPHTGEWFNYLKGGHLRIVLDNDVSHVADSIHLNWDATLRRHTQIVIAYPNRRILRDPIAKLNENREAIDVIKSMNSEYRFAMITGVEYGSVAAMRYVSPTFAINWATDVPGFYLHLKYDCRQVTDMPDPPSDADDSSPLLAFYIALRINPYSGLAEEDPTPLDLSAFDIRSLRQGLPGRPSS